MAMSGFNPLFATAQQGAQGLGSILSGLFGNSGAPYEAAGKAFLPYFQQSTGFQNPFYQAGAGAIPQYQNWLNTQANPSGFINHLMRQYQQSPYAKFLNEQGQRALTNQASAEGLIGSSPYQQAGIDYSQKIASQDMQNWLGNVLGINTQYGAGLGGLIGGGQGSANNLSNLYQDAARFMGGMSYGQEAGQLQDRNSIWSGIAKLFGG